MKAHDNLWVEPSPLPLVPYFPGAMEAATRSGSEALAQNGVRPIAALPHQVVGNVLHENYSRRADEAIQTAQALYSELFVNDGSEAHGSFRPEKTHLMPEYIKFREIDTDLYSQLGKRASLFLESSNPLPISAYEIFARQCEEEERFSDLTFAAACFTQIAKHVIAQRRTAPAVSTDTIHSLPKLTRIAQVNGDRFAVVTSKVEVGQIDLGRDTLALKSRKAGAFTLDNIESTGDHDTTIEQLYRYDRSRGRSEELLAARKSLQTLLYEQPTLVRPVVESLYLTRTHHE